MQLRTIAAAATACGLLGASIGAGCAGVPQDVLKGAVDEAAAAVMARNQIPGLVVGITAGGRHKVFNYGVAALLSKLLGAGHRRRAGHPRPADSLVRAVRRRLRHGVLLSRHPGT